MRRVFVSLSHIPYGWVCPNYLCYRDTITKHITSIQITAAQTWPERLTPIEGTDGTFPQKSRNS